MTPRSRKYFITNTEYHALIHSQREGLSVVSRRRPCSSERWDPLKREQGDLLWPNCQEPNVGNAQIRTLLDRQEEQILADCQAEIKKKTSSRLLMTAEVYETWVKLLNLSRKNFIALKQKNFKDEINNFFMHSYWSKIGIYVKLTIKVSMKWKNWRSSRVPPSTLLQDEGESRITTLSWKLQARYTNCRMKLIAWLIQEIFRMLNQFAVKIPTLPVNQCHFPPHPIPGGLLRRSIGMPCRREWPPSIWDTHGFFGKRFCQSSCVLFSTWSAGLKPWSSRTEEPLHSSTVEKSERQTQDQDPRCQTGQSARNSVIFSGGDSSKNYGADQQRLQISDLHFDACWKTRFKTE